MAKREWAARVQLSLPGCDDCGFDIYDLQATDEIEADTQAWAYLRKEWGRELFGALQAYIYIEVE